VTPASTALVPVVASSQWEPPAGHVPTPAPTFVTQLIADAERFADRRRWPRDRAADALSAYGAHPPPGFRRGAEDDADDLNDANSQLFPSP
jgi:hypothetical protein